MLSVVIFNTSPFTILCTFAGIVRIFSNICTYLKQYIYDNQGPKNVVLFLVLWKPKHFINAILPDYLISWKKVSCLKDCKNHFFMEWKRKQIAIEYEFLKQNSNLLLSVIFFFFSRLITFLKIQIIIFLVNSYLYKT